MQRKSLVAALRFTFVAGCSPGSGSPQTVTGKLTYPNALVFEATVNFAAQAGIPAGGRFKTAKTRPDGTYKLENVYPGEYQVSVIPCRSRGGANRRSRCYACRTDQRTAPALQICG